MLDAGLRAQGLLKLLSIATALALAPISFLLAWQGVHQARRPEIAMALPFVSGFAQGEAAEARLRASFDRTGQVDRKNLPPIISLSRDALRKEPLNSVAWRNLGLAFDFLGDREKARKMLRHAVALSRREAVAQQWLIQDYGQLERPKEMLARLDETLRTSSSARDLLVPRMRDALANPTLIEPLQRLLSKNPPWADQFWGGTGTSAAALVNAATLRERLRAAHVRSNPAFDQLLINGLVSNGEFDKAERLFRAVDPAEAVHEQGEFLRNASFLALPKMQPFAWQLLQGDSAQADIDPASGTLSVTVFGTGTDIIARQPVKLPPGPFRLSAHTATLDRASADILRIEIFCAEKARMREVVRIPIDAKTVEKTFVPQMGCRWFWVQLTSRPSQSTNEVSVDLTQISLQQAATRP